MRVVSSAEAYRDWAQSFDAIANPILSLESRYVLPLLGSVAGIAALDAGCGTGRWLSWLLAHGANAVGLDSSREMLQVAVAKPRVAGRLVLGDGCRAPIRPASMDLLLCCLTLGHMQPVCETLHKLASLLRPGGRLILSDFHPDALRRGWKRTYRHDGEVIAMESEAYSLADLRTSFLQLESFAEPCFGEQEREVFISAGRPELFEEASRHPAIFVASFRRGDP